MRVDAGLKEAELAILNAPFEEDGWKAALNRIAEQTRTTTVQLLGMGGPLLLPLNVIGGQELRDRHGDLGNPALYGPSNWRVGTTTIAMEIQFEEHYAAFRAANATADYDDAVSDLDIPFGCQSALLLDSANLLGVALLRSSRDGPCTADTLSRFSLLRRQMQRSVRVQLALDGEAGEIMVRDPAELSGATLLIDRFGTVCAMSEAAERLLEEEGPLCLEGLGVRFRDPADERCFKQALARLMASDGERGPVLHQTTVGLGTEGSKRWRLIACRLPRREHGLGFDPQVAVTLKAIL